MKKTAFITLLLILWALISNSQVTGVGLITEMAEKCKTIKTLRYTQIKKERSDGEIRKQVMDATMQVSPFKIYFFQQEPKKGVEGLFVTGKNDNEMLINPNGFPWININLDPYGSMARRNSHHVLHECGFQYISDVLSNFVVQCGENAEEVFVLHGSEDYNGIDCWKVTSNAPNFHYYDYTVKSGETVTSIANRLLVNDYMILKKNNLSDYNSINAGDIIKTPSAYGKRTELWFDKKLQVLRKIIIYDENGFYESFEYPTIEINPTIKAEEFTEDYDSYGF